MTDGEKMVWAAAFALALKDVSDGNAIAMSAQAQVAATAADRAVQALRISSGTEGLAAEMIDTGAPTPPPGLPPGLMAQMLEAVRKIARDTDWCPVCEHSPSTGHLRTCPFGPDSASVLAALLAAK
jgi:hypothetical protein